MNSHANNPPLNDEPKTTIDKPVERIGPFRLECELGGGHFGTVYRGVDSSSVMAVKVLHQHIPDPQTAERFRQQAAKMRRLSHPHLVRVRDADLDGDRAYVVSDLIDGSTLNDRLTASPQRDFRWIARLVADVAEALHHAHTHDLIHRDVKPANILVDRAGTAYLCDFDLMATEEELSQQRNRIAGTWEYMSPEQISGLTSWLDGRSDLFSLGVVMYQMLCGRRPFRGELQPELQDEICNRDPKPPRQINPAVPEQLEIFCLKSLQKRPEDRYATGQDLANDLRRWLDRRKRVLRRTMLIGAAALLAGVGGVYAAQEWLAPPPESNVIAIERMELFVRRNLNDDEIERRVLVAEGQQTSADPMEYLKPDDDFKLVASFSQPTHWCLLWFDTSGRMSVAAKSKTARKLMEFPIGNNFVPVDPADPPGGHVLFLVVSHKPADSLVEPLITRLASIGRPPDQPLVGWSELRGSGDPRESSLEVASTFFSRIEDKLPEGVRPVHALFLRTVK